jgi:hypothetical protein
MIWLLTAIAAKRAYAPKVRPSLEGRTEPFDMYPNAIRQQSAEVVENPRHSTLRLKRFRHTHQYRNHALQVGGVQLQSAFRCVQLVGRSHQRVYLISIYPRDRVRRLHPIV